MRKQILLRKISFISFFGLVLFQFFAGKISAQIKQVTIPPPAAQDDNTWWYITLLVLVAGLGGAIVWMLKNRNAEKSKSEIEAKSSRDEWGTDAVDADKEMEWLRKNQIIRSNSPKKRKSKKSSSAKKVSLPNSSVIEDFSENKEIDFDKLREATKAPAPIFEFSELLPSQPFSQLPISNDEALLNAIEQTHEEDEEDEELRDLAVRILAAFKARNSVESLSQVALYDISASLRSKAVSTLAEFDHESVFETILMACADPSREVRAAAARGLSRLSFERADAWTRLTETGEEGRMRHAARAAMEGGFVERSFERLIHPDKKYAYEAFAVLALLIKAGEVKPIFEALKNTKNQEVRKAILHVIKAIKDDNAFEGLVKFQEDKKLSAEVKEDVNKTIEEAGLIMA